MNNINVFSEISKLKKILLHRPGKELENLTPNYLSDLLFDDIPYLEKAQSEHDEFAKILKQNNIEVLYIESLIAETLDKNKEIKDQFIEQFLSEANVHETDIKKELFEYFKSFKTKEMIDLMIAGVRKETIGGIKKNRLSNLVDSSYPFYTDPMPNSLFTRDPFSCLGKGISLNHMYTNVRRRETIFGEYIFKYHPDYKNIDLYYKRDYHSHIEGGDELVLSSSTLAVGLSERTEATSVELLAKNLFSKYSTTFNKIYAIQLPISRSFMHLDTVLTQIDYDKFTVHSGMLGEQKIFKIIKDESLYGLKIEEHKETLEDFFTKEFDRQIKMIPCAGGNLLDSEREQWSDGANTLAIAPNKVIVYDRNYITNDLLAKSGIDIYVIPSSELSRGRGGPRCMSMPFVRENEK